MKPINVLVFGIFVGKTYYSFNQIQQQTWELVMIQNLGERGRMNSAMVSQSTAGRISESTAIHENDVRLVYLLWESSTQSFDQHLAIFSISKREVANSSTMSLTDVAARRPSVPGYSSMTSSTIATCVKRNVWFPGKRVSERRMSTCSPLAIVPPVWQVGGGIVAAKAYMGLDARNS